MPTHSELDTKLTPAAKQALDELVDDYRNQLLLGAADSASRLGDLQEIAVHDIMASLNRQQSRLFGRTRSLADRLLRVYLLGGVLLGVTGLGAFVVKEILARRAFEEQLTLIMALAGFCVSAMAYLMLYVRKSRGSGYLLRRPESEFGPGDYGSYLGLWRDIELALRRAVAVRLGESSANTPISGLLDRLEGVLSIDEQVRLRQLLQVRNSIAHGQRGAVTEGGIALAARDAERLLGRLRSLS
jgi:hypothetical protein